VSRKVSPRGRPPRTSGGLTSPTEGLLTRHSRCLGPYVLFVFLGGVSRALREKLDVEGTRLEEEADADGEAGGTGIVEEGGATTRQGSWGWKGKAGRYNAAHLAAGGGAPNI
jgi:hypothetical protein